MEPTEYSLQFTPDEKEFLKNLMASLQVNPTAKDAIKTVTLVQGIIGKL